MVEAARRGRVPGRPLSGCSGATWPHARRHAATRSRLRCRAPAGCPSTSGSVLLDGRQHWFVAHLVARRSWWRGRLVAAMNAQFLGRVGRRAPGPSRRRPGRPARRGPVVRVADRVKARRRLPQGTHVPHPAIAERRVAAWQGTFARRCGCGSTACAMGPVRHVSLRVEPDALTVVV